MKKHALSSAAVLVVVAGSTQALGAGPFGAVFELSSLNGANGFVINGIDADDRSGRSVSAAGDVNGDGVDDLIIGTRFADPNGFSSGESYVVFGGAGVGAKGAVEFSSLNGTDGFVLNGIDAYDYSGRSVSAAGDMNGDGFDDVIIGAFHADPNGFYSGESYVVFGGASVGAGGAIELSNLNGTNGFVLFGVGPSDRSGGSVSSAGDVNGDGMDDVIIGAHGKSYVVFGGESVGADGFILLSNLNGTNGYVINGIDAGDGSGGSVSAADDVNGDGVDDVIIGAHFADPNGFSSGESYVVFGGAGVGASGAFELSSLNGTNGYVINGVDEGDFSGVSVSLAGDVNGDGDGDLIIGASAADPCDVLNSGASYVIFGGANVGASGTVALSFLTGFNGYVLKGVDAFDRSGNSVSAAGDVNGDGIDDVIVGAYLADPNGGASGETYVVFGRTSVVYGGAIELSSLDGTNGFVLNGVDAGDESGFSVSEAGDINGDGIDDLIIGALYAAPNSMNSAGESYVVFGRRFNPADLNCDGVVNAFDLATLLGSWGPCPPAPNACAADLNGDGVVNAFDLALLFGSWGS